MRTQMLQFRVTDEEKTLIEKCAKKEGMTVAEYIRVCMIMEMAMTGEAEAIKIIGRSIRDKAKEALKRVYEPIAAAK